MPDLRLFQRAFMAGLAGRATAVTPIAVYRNTVALGAVDVGTDREGQGPDIRRADSRIERALQRRRVDEIGPRAMFRVGVGVDLIDVLLVGRVGCFVLGIENGDRPISFAVVEHEIEGEGLMARCLLHENDHLTGKLLVDFVGPLKRQMIKKKLQRVKDAAAEDADEAAG